MPKKEQLLPDYATLTQWSLSQVKKWLKQNNLDNCVKCFSSMEVDGSKLVHITQSDLETIKCPKDSIRTILNHVARVEKPGKKRTGSGFKQSLMDSTIPYNHEDDYEPSGSEDDCDWPEDEWDEESDVESNSSGGSPIPQEPPRPNIEADRNLSSVKVQGRPPLKLFEESQTQQVIHRPMKVPERKGHELPDQIQATQSPLAHRVLQLPLPTPPHRSLPVQAEEPVEARGSPLPVPPRPQKPKTVPQQQVEEDYEEPDKAVVSESVEAKGSPLPVPPRPQKPKTVPQQQVEEDYEVPDKAVVSDEEYLVMDLGAGTHLPKPTKLKSSSAATNKYKPNNAPHNCQWNPAPKFELPSQMPSKVGAPSLVTKESSSADTNKCKPNNAPQHGQRDPASKFELSSRMPPKIGSPSSVTKNIQHPVMPSHQRTKMPQLPPTQPDAPHDIYEVPDDLTTDNQESQSFQPLTILHRKNYEKQNNVKTSNYPSVTLTLPKKTAIERPLIPAEVPVLPAQPAKPFHTAQQAHEGDITVNKWFHGNMTRGEADTRLKQQNINGMYLIRQSNQGGDKPYTLQIFFDGRSYNLPIRIRSDQRYAIGKEKVDEKTFGTLIEMINMFKKSALVLEGGKETKLKTSLPKH